MTAGIHIKRKWIAKCWFCGARLELRPADINGKHPSSASPCRCGIVYSLGELIAEASGIRRPGARFR